MHWLKSLFSLLIGVFFVTGCTSYRSFDVKVDSISTLRAKEKKSYVLLPGNKEGKISDLQFQEFAAFTEKALDARGFRKASSIDEAQIAILLSYGISEPQIYNYACSEPIYGHIGNSFSGSSTTIHLFGKSFTYAENTQHTPSYGVVGSTTRLNTQVIFSKHMGITGVDLEQFKKTGTLEEAQEIWSTKAQSLGASNDLREIFPVLLIASQKHIADNTQKMVSYSIRDDAKLEKKIHELKN